MRLLIVMLSLSQDHRVCQCRPARGNVDRPTACEVEGGKVVEPAVAVPGPACDGTVDDRGPTECKDETGDDTSTFERAADNDLYGTCAEEHLVQAEDNLGDVNASRRRGRNDIFKAEVGEVADEGVRGARVGKGVAPKPTDRRQQSCRVTHNFNSNSHPLERRDSCDHQALEQKCKGRLSAR